MNFLHLTLTLSDCDHTHIIKLPLMTPYPGPRSVLVMDNARIHHHEDITDLVESYGSVF